MIDASRLRRIEDCKGRLKEVIGNEGILTLARDGICPHYIIKNPITNEESIWFVSSELNDWLDSNYLRYNQGHFVQNYSFLNFSSKEYEAKGQIPLELSRITGLYELPFARINTPPGVYFLCKNNKIKYIGQSSNVASRILAHISEGIKDFDRVYFISCSINRLNELESSLIRFFQPPLNQTCKIKASKNDIGIVQSLYL